MFFRSCAVSSFLALCSILPATADSLPRRDQLKRAVLASPLHFEVNRGQAADPSVRYIARGPAYALLLSADRVVMNMPGAPVRIRLVGADPDARGSVHDRMPGVTNYPVGKDPSM